MLQRAGKKIDSKEAVLKIKDVSYPAPFASELEYNSPVHGNWNIVHSGMQVPESIQIYVCADNCMRGVVLTAAEMNAADRFSFVILEEQDLLNSNLEDITVEGVTGFLKKKIIARGGDPERETLNIIPTVDNKPYYRDTNGDYWRSYRFITGASSFDQVETPQQFYESAVAFGSFQRLLADYPAETLHETIPGFHDTRARFAAFEKAVREDVVGRAAEVQKEIAFFLERKETACYFAGRLDRGELPIRVTHNDTKLNNVMLDDKTGKGVCVIDLDTVMPGLAMNDFGDAIRYGASTAAEDERDLSEVSCSMELFSLFTKGFLEGCGGSLTPEETALLPMGAKVMTYECGMRFLMDYLQGDRYFKIHRDGQNLDRARTQLTLVADMERKMQQMQDIVRKAAG